MSIMSKICGKCKHELALSCFKTRIKKGVEVPYAVCTSCIAKQLKYDNTAAGKAANLRYRKSTNGRVKRKAYEKTDDFKDAINRCREPARAAACSLLAARHRASGVVWRRRTMVVLGKRRVRSNSDECTTKPRHTKALLGSKNVDRCGSSPDSSKSHPRLATTRTKANHLDKCLVCHTRC